MLPQTLKANEKGTPLFNNSVFQGYENIYVPTDEELEEEARVAKLEELVSKPIRTNEENTQMLDLLAAKEGIELPLSKRLIKE